MKQYKYTQIDATLVSDIYYARRNVKAWMTNKRITKEYIAGLIDKQKACLRNMKKDPETTNRSIRIYELYILLLTDNLYDFMAKHESY